MDFEELKELLAAKIKEERIKRGLSQEAVAGLEISVSTYSKIELAKHGLSLKSLLLISKNMGIHPKELLDFPVPWVE